MSRKLLLIISVIFIILITVIVFLISANPKIERQVFPNKEFSLTIIGNIKDYKVNIDLYEFSSTSPANYGKEVFIGREIDKNGQIEVKLKANKYILMAKCLAMSCQQGFRGPRTIILDKDKTVRLEWTNQL